MKHIIRTVALVLVVSMLSVVAFAAAPAVPSVEQKGVPTVVPQKDEAGKPAIIVKDENGKTVETDDPAVLKVTAFGDEKAQTPEVAEKMDKAFNQIMEAKTLAEVAPELPEVLKELKVETPIENLVVRDLIHIEASEKIAKVLETEGNVIEITFELKLEAGQQLIVLVQNAEGEWLVISGDDIVIDKDGNATVAFPVLGPVAFVVL